MRAVAILALASNSFAQSDTRQPAFDVASIRPVEEKTDSSIERSGGRITLKNTSLRDTLAFAFGIATGRDHELSGPNWLNDEHFDIIATTSPETSREDVRAMLKTVLAERFGLQTHYETRNEPAYALILAPQGPRMKPSAPEMDGAFVFGPGHLSARAVSMTGLANRLSGPIFNLDRPVEDQTNTNGAFDFTLDWSPIGAEQGANPTLFTALNEQLGLQLKAQRMAVKILVVDSINRQPTPN
ncbi:MAG: TIGR03435 family protein [Bryobacteraceae bacterium]